MTNIIKTDTSDIVIHSEYEVYLNDQTLEGKHDFSKCKVLYLQDADLSKAEIVSWGSGSVYLDGTTGFCGNLDFSKCETIRLREANLSNAEIVVWPNDLVDLEDTKGLSGNLDFSKTKGIYMTGLTDFSEVSKIIVSDTTQFVLSCARGNKNMSIPEFIEMFNLGGRVKNVDDYVIQIGIDKDDGFSKVSEMIVSKNKMFDFWDGEKYIEITVGEFIEKFKLQDKVKKVNPRNIFQQEADKLSQGLNLGFAKKINAKGKR